MADFRDAVRQFLEQKIALTMAMVAEEGDKAEREMKAGAPWKDRSGAARDSLYAKTTMRRTARSARITLTLGYGRKIFYGRFLEEGAPPHIIRPKVKKALFWEGAAHPVKLVHHPGIPAGKFAIVRPTADRVATVLGERLREIWGKA